MKGKILLLIALLLGAAVLAGCGGSSSGSSSAPDGVNPGIASVIKLLPVQVIAQTNSFITLKARVIDGNGNALPNTTVNFTNMSLIGVLSSVTAVTNQNGNAEVRIFSSTPGSATILAQVNTGHGIVRDQKIVFFTDKNVVNFIPTLSLDVDMNGNSVYNEQSAPGKPGDFIFFDPNAADPASYNSAKIRARSYDGFGRLIIGSKITFSSDMPYRKNTSFVGTGSADCSDGSSTCYVAFPLGTTATTNENGEAFVQVVVGAPSLANFKTNLNISAVADTGAFNMITLFISPVSVSSLSVTAAKTVLKLGETTTVNATAMTSVNQPVPDGTTINFKVDDACIAAGGSITPFGRTTNGSTVNGSVVFTAPPTILATGICTVTASLAGLTKSLDLHISPALSVLPAAQTINGNIGGTATYTIMGGIGPYTVTTDTPSLAGPWPRIISAAPFAFDIVVPAGTSAVAANYTVTDSTGTSVSVKLNITGVPPTILPSSATIDGVVGGTVTFTIQGGAAPYTVTTNTPLFAGPWPRIISAAPFTFDIVVPAGTPAKAISYTVTDAAGISVTATLTITGTAFTILPASLTVDGVAGNTAIYNLVGGVPPYTVFTDNMALPASNITAVPPFTFDIVVPAGTLAGTVNITAHDGAAASATAKLIITSVGPSIVIFPTAGSVSQFFGSEIFLVTGGIGPYQIFITDPLSLTSVTAIAPDNTFTVTGANNGTGTVTIQVIDSSLPANSVTLTVTVL